MQLLLIRHGQSHVNLKDWDGGMIDTGLTPLGQQQSARLARWLAGRVRADVLYTSTMARALETSAYLADALHLEPQPDERLREFGNCYANGTPVPPEAMPIQYAEFWGSERPYTRISEHGESWLLFRLRVGAFLDDVVARHSGTSETADSGKWVLAVCHGGVIDAAADYVFDMGAYRRVAFRVDNTGITHLEHRLQPGREAWHLYTVNMGYHLIGEDGEWFGSEPSLHSTSLDADSSDSDE